MKNIYKRWQEDIITGVKDYVEKNITTFLKGITSNKDDNIKLPAFKEYAIDDRDPYNRGKYPVCLITPGKAWTEPLTMGEDNLFIEIQIIICITEGNKGRIVIESQRYCEAFRQAFVQDPTCGGVVDDVMSKIEFDYYPTVPGQSDKKIAIITVTVEKAIARQ